MLVLDAEPINDAPILDLRLRKGVRRHGLRLAVASPQPSSLDAGAALAVRYAPGGGAAFALALAAALAGGEDLERLAADAGGADRVRARARGPAAGRRPGRGGPRIPSLPAGRARSWSCGASV